MRDARRIVGQFVDHYNHRRLKETVLANPSIGHHYAKPAKFPQGMLDHRLADDLPGDGKLLLE